MTIEVKLQEAKWVSFVDAWGLASILAICMCINGFNLCDQNSCIYTNIYICICLERMVNLNILIFLPV